MGLEHHPIAPFPDEAEAGVGHLPGIVIVLDDVRDELGAKALALEILGTHGEIAESKFLEKPRRQVEGSVGAAGLIWIAERIAAFASHMPCFPVAIPILLPFFRKARKKLGIVDFTVHGEDNTLIPTMNKQENPLSKKKIIAIVLSFAALGFAGWSMSTHLAAQDRAALRVAPGVTVDGVAVGGLSLPELGDVVSATAEKRAKSTQLTVQVGAKEYTYDAAELGIVFDTTGAAKAAWRSGRPSGLLDKLMLAYGLKQPETVSVPIAWSLVNTDRVNSIATVIAKASFVRPTAQAIKLRNMVPVVVDGVDGQSVSTETVSTEISAAIAAKQFSSVVITPTVTPAATLKNTQAIVVRQSRFTVTLYDNGRKIKSWGCAVGQPAYPTPVGDFHIVTKQKNAPWINPGSAWAKGMPAVIGPGPSNPMGIRKLGIDYPGIFLHGIPASEYGSIGSRASHGCMRMLPSSIADLFNRVSIGVPVFIRH
jgi:lipoprotein-anchoring transpeptidase ErfK/SrfK